MRGSTKFYLILGSYCLIFSFIVACKAAAFESQNGSAIATEDSTQYTDFVGQQKKRNIKKSVDHSRQSIPEARELADFSILMEKALSSQPAAGQNNSYGNSRHKSRELIKH